jgi:6-phosphogluconolactonase
MRHHLSPARALALCLLAASALVGCGDDGATSSGAAASAATAGAGGSSSSASSVVSGSSAASTGAGGDGAGGAGGGGVSGIPYVYVGTESEILIHTLDEVTGALTLQDRIDAGSSPSFLAVDPSHRFLYAVNEGSSEVASFTVAETGALTFSNRVPTGSDGPAHVSVDATGSYVFAANYGGGSVTVFHVEADGSLGDSPDDYPTGDNAHYAQVDPSNQFLFVPNLGSDTISQFRFDAATGALSENEPPAVATASGAGPRHLAYHPGGGYAYAINELGDTVVTYALDPVAGTLAPLQTSPTLPDGADGSQNYTAEIHVTPDGRFVYGSNRGHDSLVIYAVSEDTGLLTLVGHQPTGGSHPRSFSVHPGGELLLVANRNSANVVAFAVDAASGMLTELATTAIDGAPSFVGVVLLPAVR